MTLRVLHLTRLYPIFYSGEAVHPTCQIEDELQLLDLRGKSDYQKVRSGEDFLHSNN